MAASPDKLPINCSFEVLSMRRLCLLLSTRRSHCLKSTVPLPGHDDMVRCRRTGHCRCLSQTEWSKMQFRSCINSGPIKYLICWPAVFFMTPTSFLMWCSVYLCNNCFWRTSVSFCNTPSVIQALMKADVYNSICLYKTLINTLSTCWFIPVHNSPLLLGPIWPTLHNILCP